MSDWGIPIWRRWRLLCGVLAISLLSACAGQRPNQADSRLIARPRCPRHSASRPIRSS